MKEAMVKAQYTGAPRSLFAKYAIPQMIGLLFNSIYLIVDGIFIGNVLGRDAMAAAAVSVPFIEILIALAMAVASGAGIMISSHLASGEGKEARRIFSLSILLLCIMGGLIALLGNLFLDGLARLLGATAEIQGASTEYLWHIVTFSPFLLLSFLLGGLARNDGQPKLAMFALAFGSVSNMVLDYVFMVPLNMGIGGAALATALGPIFSVLILLPHFLGKKGALYFARFSFAPKQVRRIFALGFPSFIMEFTIGIITFLYNFAIVRNGYGELGLAAYLMIGYLMLIVLTAFLGMAEGLQPVFSYYAGADEKAQNASLLSFSIKVFLAVGLLCYGSILLFARPFYAAFSPGDAELVDFATKVSAPYFSGFFLAGLNILFISFWQSTKDTKKALLISLSRSVLAPPLLVALLTFAFGSSAIWLCHSLSEGLTFLFALLLLLERRRVKDATLIRG